MPIFLSFCCRGSGYVVYFKKPVCPAVGIGGNMKQSDKLTAYYFRAAQQIDTLYLDNQMQKLLYHASQNGIAAFALYVDNGYNGLNFNRPAFSLMQQDMSDGRISKIVATSLDRISRYSLDVLAFADYAVSTGISLETINGDHATLDWNRQLYAALAAKGGECK